MLSFDISIKESVVVKYANSNILSMEEIKTTFPFIYQINSYFIFKLTPDDLFVKRSDKNFFGVVFNKNNPTNSFFWAVLVLQDFILEEKFI